MPRANWDFSLGDDNAHLSLVARVATAIVGEVRRSRLRPGDVLPGARSLADKMGVSRNTVVAAYRELAAEGWLTNTMRKAPAVALDLPASPRGFTKVPVTLANEPAFALQKQHALAEPHAPLSRGTLVMGGGMPDVRLAPAAELARAWRAATRARGGTQLLSYCDPRGHLPLRRAIAAMVREHRAIPASEDNILITRGSQMGLELVARAVMGPGQKVCVENPGYRAAWAAFARTRAELVPVRVDEHGVDVQALARHSPRAVYVTPHHQYPTIVTLSASRRMQLLEWAQRARACVIEDDFDHELAYEGRPVLPLASADGQGVVVYVGTLSKVLAPGIRVGYVVAPQPLIERLARERFSIDRQGDHVTESAVTSLLESGSIDRLIRRVRRVYRARRDMLVETLHKQLGERLSFQVPKGGMSLYARVHGLRGTVSAWSARCLAHGVEIFAARQFSFEDRELPYARLGYASLDEREIKEAVSRIARAWTLRK